MIIIFAFFSFIHLLRLLIGRMVVLVDHSKIDDLRGVSNLLVDVLDSFEIATREHVLNRINDLANSVLEGINTTCILLSLLLFLFRPVRQFLLW